VDLQLATIISMTTQSHCRAPPTVAFLNVVYLKFTFYKISYTILYVQIVGHNKRRALWDESSASSSIKRNAYHMSTKSGIQSFRCGGRIYSWILDISWQDGPDDIVVVVGFT